MPPILTAASETRLSDLPGVYTRTASALHYHRPRLVRLPVPGPVARASPPPQPTKGGPPAPLPQLSQLPQTLPPPSTSPTLPSSILMPPLRRPQLQTQLHQQQQQPCPMDNVRRMFAEPFAPGSLVPLSPPPAKRFAKRAAPSPSPIRNRMIEFPSRGVRGRSDSDACSIVPSPSARQWGLDINTPVVEDGRERTILGHTAEEEEQQGDENDDGEGHEGDVTPSLLAAPQLDLALPSPTFSPFSFDDIESYAASLTSTPALSAASVTSTPSTATFSLYSGSESGRDSRRSSRQSQSTPPLTKCNDSTGSHFSDDEDDEDNDNGQHTPKRRTPHPGPLTLENFLPPPLPTLKAVTTLPPIFTDLHGPLCPSPTSPTTTYLVDTDTDTSSYSSSGPPSPTNNRDHKRRKRHGRLMSIEEIHLVKQSFMPTDVMDAEDYWV